MTLTEVEDSISEYENSFIEFCNNYKLPNKLFLQPDHFAIKCANEDDYLETLVSLGGTLLTGTEWKETIDDRQIFTSNFNGKVAIAGYGFEMVEIMQPKTGKEPQKGFVEHLEFFNPEFFRASHRLSQLSTKPTLTIESNSGHSWLNLEIDNYGREIKFNDMFLKDVIAKEKNAAAPENVVYMDVWRNR